MHLLERLRARPAQWLDAEVTEQAAAEREAWIASGLLQPLPPATHAACPRCPDGATGVVRMLAERQTGRVTARVACAQCGLAEVPLASLQRWRIGLDRFAASLARALGSRTEPSMFADERGWSLGRAACAGLSREFFLVRAVDAESRALVQAVVGSHPKAVVFVPTTEETKEGGLLGPQFVFALSDFLSMKDGGIHIDRDGLDAAIRGNADASTKAGKKTPLKRASRVAMIEKLCDELKSHIRAAKNHAHERASRSGEPELLPRPSKVQLGKQTGLRPDEVTRCFQDKTAHQLRLLWDMADDLDQIMSLKGGVSG
jgi:hypothetical protein